MNQFSFRSRIRLGLILLITCSGLIWSSGFISANASEGEDKPQNLIVAIDGDSANISWLPGQSTADLDGYEIMAIQTFVSSQDDLDTVHNGVSISIAETENIYTFEHLSPGGWQFAIKAIYNDHQSGFQVSGLFIVSEPIGIISRNFQNIYQDVRSEFIPTITGVPDSYFLIYRVGNTILKAISLENYDTELANPVSITWEEIDTCLNLQTEINVEIIYLLDAEFGSIVDGCDDNLTINNYADRIVGSSVFNFKMGLIPTKSANFVYTFPNGEIDRERTFSSYENDPLIWPAEPVTNSRNPRTGAKFLGWMNSSNEIVSPSSSPIENMTYTQSWEIYPEPLIPFEIQIDETILTSEELADSSGNFYVTWEHDEGFLPISISLLQGISAQVTLRKIDPFSLQTDWSESADLEPGESEFILGSDEECIDSDRSTLECSDTHYLTIRTDSEGNGYSFGIFLIRQHVNETKRVTYHLDDEALVEEFEANDWSSLYEPVSYSDEHISLAKWCKEENPSQLNEEDLHCRTPDEFFAVTEDLDLYPLWIDSLIPDEISIGDQVFDSDDWIVDPENNFLYLTVIADDELPLSGEINFKSVFDLIYEPEDVLVEDIHGEELIYIEDFGYELSPGCLLPERCSMIYQISPNLILEEVFSSGYALMLIVTNSPSDTFTVDYDLSNQETISEELELGWHEVPDGNRLRSGYESSFTWANNVGGQTFEWETYFPVIEDETLTLLWIPTNDQDPDPSEPNQSNQPSIEFPRLNEAPITNTPLATNNSTNTDLQIPQKEIEVISSSAINSKKVSKRNGRIEIRASLSSQYSGKVAKLKIGKKGKAKRITLGKIKLNKKANGKFPPISYAYAGKKVGIYVGGKEVFSFVLEV